MHIECSRSSEQAHPIRELTIDGCGINLTGLLRQKPFLHISTSRLSSPDILLEDFRKPLHDIGASERGDATQRVSAYPIKPTSYAEDVVVEADVYQKQDAMILTLPVTTLSYKVLCVFPDEQSSIIERFFSLLDWEDGSNSPAQLRRVLPLLHMQQVQDIAERRGNIESIVGHSYTQESFNELLRLSRKLNVVVDEPNQHDLKYIGNQSQFTEDTHMFNTVRNQSLYGVNGISVNTTMLYPKENLTIEVPISPSTLTFYSQADSVKRRSLVTLRVTKQSNDSLVLWYENGIETGTSNGVGNGMIFSHELSLGSRQSEEVMESSALATLTARLTDVAQFLHVKQNRQETQKEKIANVDPYLVDRK